MKKILIALDYDPTAKKVAETGYDLAKAMHAQVVLLHIISDAPYYSSLNYSPIMGFGGFDFVGTIPSDYDDTLKKSAQDYLDKSKKHLGDETIETLIRSGAFGEVILNTAAEINADIIVVGTHSRSGFEKLLLGSVAENVLQHSSIPLLIIPTK